MRNTNTERKLMLFNTLYEREVPSMSKAANPKAEEMSRIHFFSIFPFAKFKRRFL